MYRKILVALDTTAADQELLPHIVQFAVLAKSELLFLHVADGWVARNFEQLNLAESEEMREDWSYLEEIAGRLRTETGLKIETRLAHPSMRSTTSSRWPARAWISSRSNGVTNVRFIRSMVSCVRLSASCSSVFIWATF